MTDPTLKPSSVSMNPCITFKGQRVAIGKDPTTTELAITGWNAASGCKSYEDFEHYCTVFKSLQILCANKMDLQTLEPVGQLRHLVHIEAKHNALKSALDYQLCMRDPCQFEEETFGGVDTVVDSLLSTADLSYNQISDLSFLAFHTRLERLYLAHNQLTRLHKLQNLHVLRVLDVSHNKLHSLIGVEKLYSLVKLYADGNEIESLRPINALRNLEELSIANNCLTHLEGIQECPRLACLDCSENQIKTVYDIEPAQDLPLLSDFRTNGNAVHKTPHARLRIIYRLQQLSQLDNIMISDEEKVRSRNLHGADVMERRNTFHKILPDQPFKDVSVQIDPLQEREISAQYREARETDCQTATALDTSVDSLQNDDFTMVEMNEEDVEDESKDEEHSSCMEDTNTLRGTKLQSSTGIDDDSTTPVMAGNGTGEFRPIIRQLSSYGSFKADAFYERESSRG